MGREMFRQSMCPACIDRHEQEMEAEMERQKRKEREIQWEAICPPLYRGTDLNDARLSRNAVSTILEWQDAGDGVGIGFQGCSGKGKTRLAYALCRRLFLDGKTVEAITSTGLARLCVECFDDDYQIKNPAKDKLRRIRTARYLLLDDMGKQKFTERVEVELYDLIETRTSNLRPIFWTANVKADDFSAMLSPDRGEPIIRRLAEFSRIVQCE